MYVSRVDFDADGDVTDVFMVMENEDELMFFNDHLVPGGLVYPLTVFTSPEGASALFKRSGKIPGDHALYEVSSVFYNAMLPVVDRFIEYDI